MFLLILFGCSTYNFTENSQKNIVFDKSYSNYDINVAWKTERINNHIKIYGLVKNTYVYTIRNFEITARGFNKNGILVCTGNYDFFPEEIAQGESKPFNIELDCKDPIDKVTFFYRHYFKGDKDMRDLNFGSFE